MATIFDREFRREKNLEQAKRQAELKKPVKKDNTVHDKKVEKLSAYLNELEETFFKDVTKDDPESLASIKQRGGDIHEKPSTQPQKEEAKKEEKKEQKPQQPPQKPQSLPVGDHNFKGVFTSSDGQSRPLELMLRVEEGGIISSQATENLKYSLNGVI